MKEGSKWFQRFVKEAKKISPYIRFVRIKHGFYRIYWKQAYIGECYKEMPRIGYDHTDNDYRFESQAYFESKEDQADLTRKIKNFVEGYVGSRDRLLTNLYMMKHSKEHYDTAKKGYQQMVIK